MSCFIGAEKLPGKDEIENIPNDRCPVNWALNVADIARLNCCGEHVMCRDGMPQLYAVITDITTGKGQPEDIELLTEICEVIKHSQGCLLASRSSELICESIERYRDEWAGHIRRKRCAAGLCYEPAVAAREVADDDGEGTRRRRRRG